MKRIITNRLFVFLHVCLALLCVMNTPCNAQKASINDHSWAGKGAFPELFVDTQGDKGSYFSAGGGSWTSFGAITDIDVYEDEQGRHVDVYANAVYYPIVLNSANRRVLGGATPASEVLHILIDPSGNVTEGVDIETQKFFAPAVMLPYQLGVVELDWVF